MFKFEQFSKTNLLLGLFFIFLGVFFIFYSPIYAAEDFDPNLIITDEEILDSSAMTLNDVKEFLKSKESFLASYKTKNADGETKSAAEIIYDAAVNNYDCYGITLSASSTKEEKRKKCLSITINPKFLLVLLQKEQGLIEEDSPTSSQLDWATGYGCPDNSSCNERWRGFGKQVNSAALQFYDYMANPLNYKYKAGESYLIFNENQDAAQITPANQATAALYNYTPHVYNGNYNFHKIWKRYFTRLFPNGSLLQVANEPGVWLIENGNKRPFLTKASLLSRFDPKKIIMVKKSDLNSYPKGAPIRFSQYSLVRSPRGTIFLLVDDKRRGFSSGDVFKKIGYNPAEVMDASWEDLNSYEEGLPLTASSTYPTGALLQNNKTGGVYWVSEGTKAPLLASILLKTKFKNKSITKVSPDKLESYTTVDPVKYGDGELLKPETSMAVYVVENNKLRPILSGEIFEKMGYKWENVITVPDKIIALYPIGDPIGSLYGSE